MTIANLARAVAVIWIGILGWLIDIASLFLWGIGGEPAGLWGALSLTWSYSILAPLAALIAVLSDERRTKQCVRIGLMVSAWALFLAAGLAFLLDPFKIVTYSRDFAGGGVEEVILPNMSAPVAISALATSWLYLCLIPRSSSRPRSALGLFLRYAPAVLFSLFSLTYGAIVEGRYRSELKRRSHGATRSALPFDYSSGECSRAFAIQAQSTPCESRSHSGSPLAHALPSCRLARQSNSRTSGTRV